MSDKQPNKSTEARRRPVVPKKKGFNSLKRPGVARGISVITLMIMVPVFFLTAIVFLLFPRSEVSNIEKRSLAKLPSFSLESYFSGNFTKELGNYFDDTVPFRDDLKTAGYNFKLLFGIHTEDEVKVIGKPVKVVDQEESSRPVEDSQTASVPESSSKPAENSGNGDSAPDNSQKESSQPENSQQTPPESEEATVENGIIVVKQNGHYRALELFGGGKGANYTEALNRFHQDLGDSVKIYSMTAPLAGEFYCPPQYSDMNASQKDAIASMNSRLDNGIIPVEITDVLGQHMGEDIYFRTDHHWTPLGAYYAAQSFAAAAGVDFKPLETYTKKDIEGFVGTMYAFTGDANINNDPETFSYYVPSNYDKCTTYYYDTSFNYNDYWDFFNNVGDPQHNAYLTFMGGDERIVKVKTDVKNGRKLLIVKDSYGNAVPGYLFGSFEEIYIVDMRYFDLNLVDFVKQNKVTDMLFAMVTYSAVGDNADNLENLRTQAKGRTITDGALKEDQAE